jgi:hypothetical protein
MVSNANRARANADTYGDANARQKSLNGMGDNDYGAKKNENRQKAENDAYGYGGVAKSIGSNSVSNSNLNLGSNSISNSNLNLGSNSISNSRVVNTNNNDIANAKEIREETTTTTTSTTKGLLATLKSLFLGGANKSVEEKEPLLLAGISIKV